MHMNRYENVLQAFENIQVTCPDLFFQYATDLIHVFKMK